MRYTQPFEQNKNEALFTKDEQRFVRWLSDYISVEEMLSSGVDSLKDTDKLFKPQMSDGKANTWKRLNQFISRIILRHSNFIPE